MRLLICFVALSVLCCASATPTPQFLGGGFQPFTPFGNWLQNSLQNIPRPTFFQSGILNAFRPQAQVQVAPPSPQQVVPLQQVTPAQTNTQWPQTIEFPDRQINSNNGWYWQNWVPLPIIPQYGQDQSPTIIIISRPAKQPIAENSNSNATASSGSTATATSGSNQSTDISVVVPITNEPSTNSSAVPVSNSTEPLQNVTSTTTTTSTPLPTSSGAQSSSTLATEIPTQGNTSAIPHENATNVPDLGLTILNPVPLAQLESTTTNTSVPETTAQ